MTCLSVTVTFEAMTQVLRRFEISNLDVRLTALDLSVTVTSMAMTQVFGRLEDDQLDLRLSIEVCAKFASTNLFVADFFHNSFYKLICSKILSTNSFVANLFLLPPVCTILGMNCTHAVLLLP